MTTGEWIQLAAVSVLAVTLGAVLWYAWEARKLAKEAREQRLLTMRPIVLLSPFAEETELKGADEAIRLAVVGPLPDTTPVTLTNVGSGVAVALRVPYKLPEQGPGERVVDYLPPSSVDIEHYFHLAPKEGRSHKRMLKITYYDVFGNPYESTREFHKDPDSNHYGFTPLVHREVAQ